MVLGSKSKKVTQRLWRPDFRDVQVLPDTKVIRTGFLLNFIAIAVTLAVLTLYLFKEYSLQTVSASVASLEKQVAEAMPENRSILDANKRFKQSAAIMEEVVAFDRQLVDYPLFVRELSGILPDGVQLRSLEMRSSPQDQGKNKIPPLSVELRGTIVGSPSDTPSQIIGRFQEAILGIPSLETRGATTDLRQFQRNNEEGSFSFTLQILIQANPASTK